jgi:hypothetical protein
MSSGWRADATRPTGARYPTACQIIGRDAVVVVGSQSILGSFTEDELPAEATMSAEVDILPLASDNA